MLELRLGGETVSLHAEGALHWAREATLVIADPHFGKDDLFRRAGIAVPRGPTISDLQRLTRVLESTGSRRLLIVGDLVHGATEHGDDLPRLFALWRRHHASLDVLLVAGNHDRHENWDAWSSVLDVTGPSLHEPPFVFAHEPEPDPRGIVIAGHLHPVFAHEAFGRRALRVFWRRRGGIVLPSWGEFTGGARVVPAPSDGVFACTPEGVLTLQAGDRAGEAGAR